MIKRTPKNIFYAVNLYCLTWQCKPQNQTKGKPNMPRNRIPNIFLRSVRMKQQTPVKKPYRRNVQMWCYKYLPCPGASQAAAAPLTLFPVPLPTGGCASAACLMVHTMSSIRALSWRSDIAAGEQGVSRGHRGYTVPQTPHTRYSVTFIQAFLPPLWFAICIISKCTWQKWEKPREMLAGEKDQWRGI